MLMMDDFYKIEEILKDKSDDMINFHKIRILKKKIEELKMSIDKNMGWILLMDQQDEQVYAYLTELFLDVEILSETKMYQISKQIEPRIPHKDLQTVASYSV